MHASLVIRTATQRPGPRRQPFIESLGPIIQEGLDLASITVREILDAIQALPRPDRLRLVEQLNDEALRDRLSAG